MFLFKKNTPRFIVFIVDIIICLFSLALAYLLRFNFADIPPTEIQTFFLVFPFVLGTRAISFLLTGTHKGIVRYAGSKDAQRIFLVLLSGSSFFILSNLISYYFFTHSYVLPFSILIIEFTTSTFLMISMRLAYKSIYQEWKNPKKEKSNIIIFGAGAAGLITKRTIDRDEGIHYNILAFIDDNRKIQGSRLEGVTIYGFDKLSNFLKTEEVSHVIISAQQLSPEKKESIANLCFQHGVKILNVPPVRSWINGELSLKQIKKIRIEELLERNQIKLETENIQKQVLDKIVFVTGAAGSIGSELVRQLSKFNPKNIILIDIAESPLYEIELELKNNFRLRSFEIVIADIRNKECMDGLFRQFHPQIIFHAAAYKHVPMMEQHPTEAVINNVKGTKVLADLSAEYKVEKFVMVSTDKAVNPTNVMGASKRIAEIYVQAIEKKSQTQFVTTRFGNVLGSNGSAIQLFNRQIQKGGPITVTHPDITRFFMTIPEACQLVLEAGAMGKGGEIFLFDMGESVKVADVAKKMVLLAGLTPGKDIQIVYTGLRPGEKLFEELLATKENSIATHHPKIMTAKVRDLNHEKITEHINQLIALAEQNNSVETVRMMKQIVPEYISKNSVYEKLDNEPEKHNL